MSRHNLGLFLGLSSGLAAKTASAALLPSWSDLVSALQPQKSASEPEEFSFIDDEGTMLEDEGTARLGFVQVRIEEKTEGELEKAETERKAGEKTSDDKWKPMKSTVEPKEYASIVCFV